MEPVDDQLFDCEYRTYGDDIAYVCICGSKHDFPSLDEFAMYAESLRPEFNQEDRTLTAGGFKVRFMENHDKTQYI